MTTIQERYAAHQARLKPQYTGRNCRTCGKPGTHQGSGATRATKPWYCDDHVDDLLAHNRGMA